MLIHISRYLSGIALLTAAVVPAHAQLAVIDVPAIAQLVQQVRTLQQEVATTEAQLTQARQALQTMTGDRGMERLLGGIVRNYLPSTWSELQSAMRGAGYAPAGLAGIVQSVMSANAVLTNQQLSSLSAAGRQQVMAGRQTSALRQSLAQQALMNTSARFASIQGLIGAISGAADQKGILDLQARINAELGMLQNEQTKLQVLYQAALAQEAIDRQRQHEQIVAGQGSFADRFQPAP